ncbi:sugar dehydrogenase complex small subunit [Neokomagataea thailandica]|uniref:Uncharacterized protein n=1 Tax=Neokomagataea tanensis NBRC 106556 TaxID=1223519 RepID=A0ABQ0QIP4_9PROT|nr:MULTISPECIES: sugar dehydrogenase complex small subunit [Neokomagataea]GBR46021.1 hypothetical protein AA106556_0967 [Neokomagataea tanensis NBRC 106556]
MAGPDFLNTAPTLTRRHLALASGAALVTAYGWAAIPAMAQDVVTTDPTNIDTFMTLSRFVTGHSALNLTTGAALLSGLQALHPTLHTDITTLNNRIAQSQAPDIETFDAQFTNDPLRPLVLQIIKGWYAGVLEDGTNAKVYAFGSALMYQTSRDNVVIPTYAHNGPNYWLAEPNPVDVMPKF